MIKRIGLTLPMLGAMFFALTSPASADIIDMSLSNPAQFAAPGDTLTFVATISAPLSNLAAVFLNSDALTADFPLTGDDTPFLNFPLSLSPGGSATDVLFTIMVPNFAINTPLTAHFELFGGVDSNASDSLGSVDAQINVTPEPASVFMLGAALLALAFAFRRRLSWS